MAAYEPATCARWPPFTSTCWRPWRVRLEGPTYSSRPTRRRSRAPALRPSKSSLLRRSWEQWLAAREELATVVLQNDASVWLVDKVGRSRRPRRGPCGPLTSAASLWSAPWTSMRSTSRAARSATSRLWARGHDRIGARRRSPWSRRRGLGHVIGNGKVVAQQETDRQERVVLLPVAARSTKGERNTIAAGGCAVASSVTTPPPRLSPK